MVREAELLVAGDFAEDTSGFKGVGFFRGIEGGS